MQQLEYELSNAIGVVLDKTVDPPKVLGQAFIVSKSRMVTNASGVFSYTEAPWALTVHFPFPDVKLAVKAVNLHNDFDKVAARGLYLAQQGSPVESPFHTFANDIAVLIIDPQPPEVPQDRIAELNRALSLPFSGEGVEASGNLRGTEFVNIIETALQAGREGLLTLFDSRNIPVAQISLARGTIAKVFFQQVMSSEMAFCELVYRQPAAGFAFKPGVDINWGDVPDVQTPADRLTWEAMRRTNEIPKLLQQLGGLEARYQQVVQTFDPEAASEEIRWMVAPLWQGLDGYVSLDKLPKRVGVDTYTILVAIRELVNRGVASQINRISPFPCTGQLGTPLVSHTDFEVHPWDPLQAFYLDPLSGKPTWLEGNFFGVANSLQPKNMLHTIALAPDTRGALILKDYKLIGLHTGAQELKPGQPAPPVKCYQFMWMGALLDLSMRKVKSPGEADDEGVGTLRSSLDALAEEGAPNAASSGTRIQCPTCFAINSDYGNCATCGTMIEAPPEEPEPSNKIMASKPVKEIKKLQKKYNLSNTQVGLGVAVLCLPLMMMVMCSHHPEPEAAAPTQQAQPVAKTPPSDKKAVQIAIDEAGFSPTAPPMYWFKDTTDQTSPSPSFGLYSEQANQKILFVIYEDMAPVDSLKQFVGRPPYVEVDRCDYNTDVLDRGSQILGGGKMGWILAKYTEPGVQDKILMMLASFPGIKDGKSILVVAKGYDPTKIFNHKTTLFVLDEIASELTAKANSALLEKNGQKPANEDEEEDEDVAPAASTSASKDDEKTSSSSTSSASDEDEEDEEDTSTTDKPTSSEANSKYATDEQIDEFLTTAQKQLQEALDLPEVLADAADKYEVQNQKPKKWKEGGLVIGVDPDGVLKRIELLPVPSNDKTESLNKALESAVQATKFKSAPLTRKPEFKFQVRLQGKEIVLRKI
ncbi:MAG: hypothetical protein K2X93_05555 [Candidatus Obscuribacterales bacterium]|nr:hypothetical protein [Candidatus Obscuribacterales bacterium]